MRCACSGRAVADQRSDERDRVLGLVRGGEVARPDRPDRLVRDHNLAEAVGLYLREPLLHLVAKLALGLACLALLLGLAHAQDRAQPGRQRRRDLELQGSIRLAEHLPSLGVAEEHPVDVELGQHRG